MQLDEELREMDQKYYFQEGLKQGIQEKEKEMLENKKEMIINLYNNKVPIKTIAESANLTIKEVQKIINGNN